MLVIGLTGGIGSGKTTVAKLFKTLGVTIIDSDIIARELVQPGTTTLHQISQHFGATVLNAHGALDRAALRQLIFNNPNKRQWLEALLHPLIRDKMSRQIKQTNTSYVIVVIPLLLESPKRFPVDRILVVDVPETLQQQRATQRDHHAFDSIDAIMATQVSRKQRLNEADDIIDNSGSLPELKKQVQALDANYRGLLKNNKTFNTK